MFTIDDLRRQNLNRLVQELGGNKALAERVGVSESQMNQWVNGAKESKTGKARGMRLASCHRIEDKTGKPRGWLDTQHDDQATGGAPGGTVPAAAPALSAALPVVLAALAGLPAARAVSVRAQLDLVMGHPEMHDEALAELQHLLAAPAALPRKQPRAA